MKNYLIILMTSLLLVSQVFAMAAKNADAARDTTTDTQTTDVSANTATPVSQVPVDESQATLDQSISRRGAMDAERLAQRREARKANREVASRARDIALQTDKLSHAPVSGTASGTIRK